MPQSEESGIRQVTHHPLLNGKESGKTCGVLFLAQFSNLLFGTRNLRLDESAAKRNIWPQREARSQRRFASAAPRPRGDHFSSDLFIDRPPLRRQRRGVAFGWLSFIEVDRA